MLYLEDYLEMIEHLPQELRDRFTEMREMDLQVHNAMDNLEEQVKQFFSNAKRMKVEQRDVEYDKIRQEYLKTLEDAEEKVHLANQIYELVEKYLKRLDQELQKFKIELEADHAGITEMLERRSLELDNPPPVVVNHVREKRKYTFHNSNNSGANSHAAYHHDRHGVTPTEKVLSSIAQEAFRETIDNANSTGVITSNNITSNRLSSNAFTPLFSVVNNANNSSNHSNGNLAANSLSPLITPNSLPTAADKGSNAALLPHSSFRIAGNNAIAAAASQAIAATQQMQQGRRTASLKASYEAINNSGFSNIYGMNSSSLDSNSHHDITSPLVNNHSLSGYGYDSMTANKSGRSTKRNRNTSHYIDSSSTSMSINSNAGDDETRDTIIEENNGAPDWTYDPNEPRYCICNQISYGDMVACDNEDCDKEWFHYGCVGITQPPKGKWFCPDCADRLSKRKSRKDRC